MNEWLILITGPKHSGKSMTSRALEKITGREAADLDELVERQTGKTPRELFKEGAEIFRKAEARALASLMQSLKFGIIAAGGGIIDNSEALALLSRREKIITVYLDVSAETAWQRIQSTAAGGELPPFLNTEDPRGTHRALHTRRGEAYKAFAGITIAADNKTPEEIAGEIVKFL